MTSKVVSMAPCGDRTEGQKKEGKDRNRQEVRLQQERRAQQLEGVKKQVIISMLP